MIPFRSIAGATKSIEQTEKALQGYLPVEGQRRILYAAHRFLDDPLVVAAVNDKDSISTEFIGCINILPTDSEGDKARRLDIPEHMVAPKTEAPATLTVEIGYAFLPDAWGKGYATETANAVVAACKRTPHFWQPWTRVYLRAIVNDDIPASLRVLDKTSGMDRKGIYHWKGEPFFLRGEWVDHCDLHVYGMYLLE